MHMASFEGVTCTYFVYTGQLKVGNTIYISPWHYAQEMKVIQLLEST